MLDINTIINILPEIIIYVVPGFLFLSVHNFICAKQKEETNNLLIKSIVISYIFINIMKFIELVFKYKFEDDLFSLITILLSILSSYYISRLYNSNVFDKILALLIINKSVHDDIWNDIIDVKHGMYMEVYLPNEKVSYYGQFRNSESKKDNKYIVISNYELKDYNGNIICDFEHDYSKCVMINTKDISRFEICYNIESYKAKPNRL